MRHSAIVGILVCVFAASLTAQSPAPRRSDQVRGAIIGSIVGAAVGAGVGFALGSLGSVEPTCINPPGGKCEGHNFAWKGARIGFVAGIPVGAIVGWRRTRRS